MYIQTVNFTLLAVSLWPPIEALAQVSNNYKFECILTKKTDCSGVVLEFYKEAKSAGANSTILQTLLSFQEQSIARVTISKSSVFSKAIAD
jgi:hypothetical protein